MNCGRSRPRTVLFLHGSSGGYGADRQLQLLASSLDQARYRPLVVLPERGELAAQLEAAGIEVEITPLAVLRRDLAHGHGVASTAALLRRNARELGELALRRRAAIVHTNYSLVLCGQAVAERSFAAHFLHVREIYVEPGSAAHPLWPVLRRRLLRADAVACVADAVAAQFPRSERVFVLYDGLTRKPTRASRETARRALQIDEHAFVVATIGRISDWKGQDVLLRALADPVLTEIGAVGLVAGDAAPHQRRFEDDLAGLSDTLDLDGRVRLLGFRKDVEVLLGAADAVAVPSTYPDSLPNAAIEGAAAGLPVVATDTGGQREIVRDGVTGHVVPPGDASALARALRGLADDPAGSAELGRAGAQAAADRFDATRLVDEVQDYYDRLLAARKPGPAAWLVPEKPLAVAQQAAPELRIARQAAWLAELGYRPTVLDRTAVPLFFRALRGRPAVILTAAARHAPSVWAIKQVRGRRTRVVADVIGLHSLEIDQALPSDWARPPLRAVWKRLERRLTRTADLVLAVNDRHADLVRQRYRRHGVFTLRDTAEPGVVDITPLERAGLGIPESAVVVGFAGSIVYSRLDPLFDAWHTVLASTEQSVCLLIVGDGPDLERYRRRAAQAGWGPEAVVFLGGLPREDALAALRACDIGYSDCWTEAGFPAKLFEYMALGLPIVTEGTPQATEVLGEERDALLYRTPEELVEQMLRLVSDPQLRRRLGELGRRSFLERHAVERRQQEFEAFVDGLRQPPRSLFPRPEPELVSVVVPVRDAEANVADQLDALADQTFSGAWELVVVDNGCTDRTIEIVESRRCRLPALDVVREPRRGLNRARNAGAAAARGDLLAFCDADDVVAPGWLAALVESARHADLVGGALDLDTLNDAQTRGWRPYAPPVDLPVPHGFLPYVPGGNCAVWADVARELCWDESYEFGSSDVEFAWRAQLAGYRARFAPDAVVRIRFHTELSRTLRQHVAYGVSAPHLYRSFRVYGMRSSGLAGAARRWTGLAWNSPDLIRSSERRGHWLRLASESAGRLAGSARRLVFFP